MKKTTHTKNPTHKITKRSIQKEILTKEHEFLGNYVAFDEWA